MISEEDFVIGCDAFASDWPNSTSCTETWQWQTAQSRMHAPGQVFRLFHAYGARICTWPHLPAASYLICGSYELTAGSSLRAGAQVPGHGGCASACQCEQYSSSTQRALFRAFLLYNWQSVKRRELRVCHPGCVHASRP